MNLTFDMPASVLADLLGMHIKTVNRWTVELKRDWSQFVSIGSTQGPTKHARG